ncbi:MAG TPA: T9SS type A sorting domain-containing protein [Flavipsychrobacter sp.]|nr:T9SS type A sorting domain-containing protein [Flavipsychrobacter sp.]
MDKTRIIGRQYKKIFLTFITIAQVLILNAQQIKIIRTNIVGSQGGLSLRYAIPAQDGGIFCIGTNADSGTIDVPPCGIANNNVRSVAVKIDSNGSKQWVKMYCNFNEEPSTGCTAGEKGFAIGEVIDTEDIYLRKLDCSGRVQWQKKWGSSRQDAAFNIICTSDGGYLIQGVSAGNDGDIPVHHGPLTAWQYWDWVLVKTDSLGNKEWLKVYGSTGDEEPGGVLEVGDYYYMFGRSDGHTDDCVDTVSFPQSAQTRQTYVLKINKFGNVIWSRAYGTSADKLQAIFDDQDSTILFGSTVPPSMAPFNTTHTQADFGIIKIDLDGNIKWAKAYGDNHLEYFGGLCRGPGSSYLVAGYSNGGTNEGAPRIGKSDGWLFWIDSVGNIIDNKLFGSTGQDYVDAIVPFKKNYMIITESAYTTNIFTEGTWQFSPGAISGLAFTEVNLWTTGVHDRKLNSVLKAYPNPTNRFLNIELLDMETAGDLRLYNQLGQLQLDQRINSKKCTMEVSNLSSGTYILTWQPEVGSLATIRVTITH